jgi:Domain of unknown function (DUF4114)/PEP-CTERM motif
MQVSKSLFIAAAVVTSGFAIALSDAFQAQAQSLTYQPLSADTTGFKNMIGDYQQFVQGERIGMNNPEARRLDPTKLLLKADHNVKVFFLNEGAAKRNTLQYAATGTTPASGTVFEKIACINGCVLSDADGNMNIGDWVSLGNHKKGTLFDFMLLAKNDNGGPIDTYRSNSALNPDGLAHMVAYEYKNRVVLGFEDLFGELGATGGRNEGSDRDFNDVMFVLDMPVERAEATPEPTTMAGMAIAGAGIAAYKRRQRRKAAKG